MNIPRRAFWFVFRWLVRRLNLFNVATDVQSKKMQAIGLSRVAGLAKLNNVLSNVFGRLYDEQDGMFSEHLVLLASISVVHTNVERILEIGTFDGRTALILSCLFPQAKIITIDLPSNETTFQQSYNRHASFNNFITKRDDNVRRAGSVEFREANSLELADYQNENFDLIWIDGAHGYPVVAMDVINSYRLSNRGAFVLIDDVWEHTDASDKMYKSIGGLESLNALVSAKLIPEYHLFHKRLGGVFNYPGQKKYVGCFRK